MDFPYESSNVLLGRGGSGAVFLGKNGETQELFAIKRCYTKMRSQGSPKCGLPQSTYQPFSRSLNVVEIADGLGSTDESSNGALITVGQRNHTEENELDHREESNMEAIVVHHQQLQQQQRYGSHEYDGHDSASEDERFDESQLLQYIGPHPHIARYHGHYTSSRNVTFLAIELMQSDVARELRDGNGSIKDEDTCMIVTYSVLLALAHVHAKGIAHRDVKPGNLLLKVVSLTDQLHDCNTAFWGSDTHSLFNGETLVNQHNEGGQRAPYARVTLGDFSAAHFIPTRDAIQTPSGIRGTLHYKAPEQLLSKKISDVTACDAWGLGCTLYEMLTGSVAFQGQSELQVLMQIFYKLGSNFDDYPSQSENPALFQQISCSSPFKSLLQRLLVIDPMQRCTVQEALVHPLFDRVREQLAALHMNSQTSQLCFKLKLLYSCRPDMKKLHVHFRPIAMPRLSFMPLSTEATTEAAGRKNRLMKASEACDDRIVTCINEEAATTPNASAGNPPQSCMTHCQSLMSEGPSVHWSDIKAEQSSVRSASTVKRAMSGGGHSYMGEPFISPTQRAASGAHLPLPEGSATSVARPLMVSESATFMLAPNESYELPGRLSFGGNSSVMDSALPGSSPALLLQERNSGAPAMQSQPGSVCKSVLAPDMESMPIAACVMQPSLYLASTSHQAAAAAAVASPVVELSGNHRAALHTWRRGLLATEEIPVQQSPVAHYGQVNHYSQQRSCSHQSSCTRKMLFSDSPQFSSSTARVSSYDLHTDGSGAVEADAQWSLAQQGTNAVSQQGMQRRVSNVSAPVSSIEAVSPYRQSQTLQSCCSTAPGTPLYFPRRGVQGEGEQVTSAPLHAQSTGVLAYTLCSPISLCLDGMSTGAPPHVPQPPPLPIPLSVAASSTVYASTSTPHRSHRSTNSANADQEEMPTVSLVTPQPRRSIKHCDGTTPQSRVILRNVSANVTVPSMSNGSGSGVSVWASLHHHSLKGPQQRHCTPSREQQDGDQQRLPQQLHQQQQQLTCHEQYPNFSPFFSTSSEHQEMLDRIEESAMKRQRLEQV